MRLLPLLCPALLLLPLGQAWAAPLNLQLNDTPDIFFSRLDGEYVASTEIYTLNHTGAGSANLKLPDALHNITDKAFSLLANIDNAGNLKASGGSLTIGGQIGALGFTSGTLLTGTLTAFGFPNPGGANDPLEFMFSITGGDAKDLYGGVGKLFGVILNQSGYGGSWAANFDNGFLNPGQVDVRPLPEPGSLVLWSILGLAGIGGFSRRRRHRGEGSPNPAADK